MSVTEAAFESHIESWLLTNGSYLKSDPANLDRALGQ